MQAEYTEFFEKSNTISQLETLHLSQKEKGKAFCEINLKETLEKHCKIKNMTSMSGKAKITRALNQLVNVQILLGGLPKEMQTPEDKRKMLRSIIEDLQKIEEKIKKTYGEGE